MAALTADVLGGLADDLTALAGREVILDQGIAVIRVVASMASAYTRGRGFTDGEPHDDVRAVILSAAARLYADTSQVTTDESMGPFRVSRTPFDGWSTAELFVLDRYRQRAW